ncbi:MAG: hypothetical protein GWP59_01365 [Chlamydiales bacterium]|nr:histidine phosphatase family protein [Chlamydiales bacterium]NCF70327.1 hypothetical protein [Chlamydiales bacterium]
MTLQLVLVRHALPLTQTEANVSNELLRPISEAGKTFLHQLCLELKSSNSFPDKILTSPILRAKQSAEIIASHFHTTVKITEALSYEFDPDLLIREFSSSPEIKTLYCIGHNPHLSYFAQILLKPSYQFEGLKPGWAIAINFEGKVEEAKGSLNKLFTY